ncbi:MAG: hypothetical protein WD489_05470 [Rhodovibrionaceae bacterium]
MYRRFAVLSVVALGLSGCLTDGQNDQNLYADEPVPIVEPAQDTQLAALPPVPARRPTDMSGFIPPGDAHLSEKRIDDLVGLSRPEIEDLLGGPSMEEVQPPARVWSYHGQECVLSIFFYPRVGGEDFRALAYEVKGPGQNQVAPQAPRDASAAVEQPASAGDADTEAAMTVEDRSRCFTTLIAQNASARRAAAEVPAAPQAPTSQPVE